MHGRAVRRPSVSDWAPGPQVPVLYEPLPQSDPLPRLELPLRAPEGEQRAHHRVDEERGEDSFDASGIFYFRFYFKKFFVVKFFLNKKVFFFNSDPEEKEA